MRAPAPAKINLALVVGPRRPDGKHEVTTVLQRIDLGDRISLTRRAGPLFVDGFADDTIVRAALETLAQRANAVPAWIVRISKRIPVLVRNPALPLNASSGPVIPLAASMAQKTAFSRHWPTRILSNAKSGLF